ncbi:uncharacterized protein LOC131664606, partial [Phymastichus coffea]|uniref:uncharacterized protein LOC131664606 n=1 Tax=Phymastichus coffea TaxID=108790 RepID=UPI00273ACB4B
MDNSAYVPNQLPPPLVVFSQAGGFSEAALRMQRPFNPQIGEAAKDLSSPFNQAAAAASLDYRLHHMLHLQHQFLHPLDHRLPFGSSAFRPLAPSAFAPPQKRLKLEAAESSPGGGGGGSGGPAATTNMSSLFSPAAQAATELAPQSPANSTSRSPPGSQGSGTAPTPNAPGNQGAEEDREASATPCSENTERSTPEEGRPYR